LFGGDGGLSPVIDVRAEIWPKAILQRSTAFMVSD